MMIQTALVTILFIAACIYLGKISYNALFKKQEKCSHCPAAGESKLK